MQFIILFYNLFYLFISFFHNKKEKYLSIFCNSFLTASFAVRKEKHLCSRRNISWFLFYCSSLIKKEKYLRSKKKAFYNFFSINYLIIRKEKHLFCGYNYCSSYNKKEKYVLKGEYSAISVLLLPSQWGGKSTYVLKGTFCDSFFTVFLTIREEKHLRSTGNISRTVFHSFSHNRTHNHNLTRSRLYVKREPRLYFHYCQRISQLSLSYLDVKWVR